MQTWAKLFVSKLFSEKLRPAGFKKSAHTFSRSQPNYLELFQIQGSQWNAATEPTWTFYVNFGVVFPDLAKPSSRSVSAAHVFGRLTHLSADIECAFGITESNAGEVATRVAESFFQASIAINEKLPMIYSSAKAGKRVWLPTA